MTYVFAHFNYDRLRIRGSMPAVSDTLSSAPRARPAGASWNGWKHATCRPSGSRATGFEWDDRSTWGRHARGRRRGVHLLLPDIAVPGAAEAIGAFAELAAAHGVQAARAAVRPRRARGPARRARDAGRRHRMDRRALQLVRAELQRGVHGRRRARGRGRRPRGRRPEPFVDAEDIADVAVAALTEDGHDGEVYELTGPRALHFDEAVAEIAAATGRPLRFTPVPVDAFAAGMREAACRTRRPRSSRWLFTEILDGRNAEPQDGVQPRARPRPARLRRVRASHGRRRRVGRIVLRRCPRGVRPRSRARVVAGELPSGPAEQRLS